MYTEEEKNSLREVARNSIKEHLRTGRQPRVNPADFPEKLREERAAFVTLKKSGRLRGCIGTIEARKPLVVEVSMSACSAAFHDPRFEPLSSDEFSEIDIHISVLSPMEPIEARDESELLRLIEPGTGLLLESEFRSSTFLPEVWETLPDPAEFLARLKEKAGLNPEKSYINLKYYRYTTVSF